MRVSKGIYVSLLLLLTWCASGPNIPLDDRLERILEEYFRIHASLAADSIDGIDRSAHAIDDLVSQTISEDPALRYLLGRIQTAARGIQHQDIAAAREQFFELTKPLLVCLHKYYSGDREYFRYFCSKAEKAWIQQQKGVKNPYLGCSGLTSGYLVH